MKSPLDNVTAINDKLYGEITNIIFKMESLNHRKLLFISDFQFRTKMNLMLLKFFLEDKKQRGLFITFDRPHQYISKILKNHNIDQEKLTFIDAVSFISGEVSQGRGKSVRFVRGPYQIGLFKNLVGRCFNSKDVSKQIVDIKDIDFIMIDDISALSIYNEMDEVKEFIENFYGFVDSLDTFVVALAMDANYNKEVYKVMSQHCEVEVLVNPSKFLVKVIKSKNNSLSKGGFDIIPKPKLNLTAKRKAKDVIV